MSEGIERVCVREDATLRDAMRSIDRHEAKIALVVDDRRRLLDTITDGDIRRALLDGIGPDDTVALLESRKRGSAAETPVTAPHGTSRSELRRLMRSHSVLQIPLLDEHGRVVELATRRGLLHGERLPVRAVIMAGGMGTRLRPLTENVPKPMLPVGDRPLLEVIVERLRRAGIEKMVVTTRYKASQILEHFGDGARFGVELDYIWEHEPLGTAGSLGLLERSRELVLVTNGDVLTQIDYRAVVDFHRENRADMTVTVRPHEVTVPFGVVETEGVNVRGIAEKPVIRHFINAGVYLLDPSVLELVPSEGGFDMPDLITSVIGTGGSVIGFPVRETWIDIGQLADYEAAQEAFRANIA